MDWKAYTTALVMMFRHFGKDCYTKEQISKGFLTWKGKDVNELLKRVDEAIGTNRKFNLYESIPTHKSPSRTIYRHPETHGITDGFLDRYLAMNGCKSVLDLINKNKPQE